MKNLNSSAVQVAEANFKTSTCLFTFYQQKYFLPTADEQKFSVFVSKVQNEQGICCLLMGR